MSPPELEKVYSPHEVEERWSRAWIDACVSVGPEDPQGRPTFSVVIPPPNITGSLHLGHALNNTLQDILVRYHRMKGDATLWVFGTDHAGIATQNVVERKLAAEGLSRHDVGREEFVRKVWEWRKESGGMITQQLKLLGASLDWSRERFTMDEGLSRAVREVFVSLYEEGLLYRDQRLINWCPRCHTALSDLEVDYHEVKGHLWHIRYNFEGDPEHFVTVATTRPETLLGDTAVAVNPEDERYKSVIGKTVVVPFVERLVPVIADPYVDSSFGSGVVKITPAHDFNDFEIGKRHGLEKVNVLSEDGRMNENAGRFQGMDRFEARREIVKALEETGQMEKIEDYKTNVGHCYRCKTIVEPYLSLQWFVKTKPLAEPAMEAVRKGETQFFPKHWEKTYFSWMENIKDWCVSRQIWWGHRIPAWYCGEGHITVSREDPKKCSACGSKEMIQDPDVLDTWFSSALWPFSTLGWPEKTKLLETYYPTSVLVTSFDIIFFWVARMMMMGLKFMKEVPFRHVYIHALVRDAMGQKMSKSKGNVVDPLGLMKEYGTDALRFTLAALAAQGRDIKLSEDRVEGYRNFCNKIWNAARYIFSMALPHADLNHLEETDFNLEKIEARHDLSQWILVKLSNCIQAVKNGIDEYKFNEAAMAAHQFFWGVYCDWFLELIKVTLKSESDSPNDLSLKKEFSTIAVLVLDQALRLLHPFMPFITEELWQTIHEVKNKSIAIAPFPVSLSANISHKFNEALERIEATTAIVEKIRQIKAETGVPPAVILKHAHVYSADSKILGQIDSIIHYAINLTRIPSITHSSTKADPKLSGGGFAKGVTTYKDIIVYVNLSGVVDLKKEKQRQMKELERLQKSLTSIENKLSNPDFKLKAPQELVEEKEKERNTHLQRISEIQEAINLL